MNGLKKFALIFLAVLVFVAVVGILLIIRVKTPEFRLASVTVNSLSFTNKTNSASFEISLYAVYAVKNPNFTPFKYQGTDVDFSYRGKTVGMGRVVEGKVNPLSTKKVGFGVRLSSRAFSKGSGLGRDIGSGRVSLSVASELRGQQELIYKVIKKARKAEMSCTVLVNLVYKVVQNIQCD